MDLIDQCEQCGGRFPISELEFSGPALQLLCPKCRQSNSVEMIGSDERDPVQAAVAHLRKIEVEVNALPTAEVERRLAALPPHWQPAVARAKGETDRRALLADFLLFESAS